MNIRLHIEVDNVSVPELEHLRQTFPGVPLGPVPFAGPLGPAPLPSWMDLGPPRPPTGPAPLPSWMDLGPPRPPTDPAGGLGPPAPPPPQMVNPLLATLPAPDDAIATAAAIVAGQLAPGTLSQGGPGSLGPRRRTDPQRVQAVADLLLEAHLQNRIDLGAVGSPTGVSSLAEQVLSWLDAGGQVPGAVPVVRQADADVPAVVRDAFDAELLAIAHEQVRDAWDRAAAESAKATSGAGQAPGAAAVGEVPVQQPVAVDGPPIAGVDVPPASLDSAGNVRVALPTPPPLAPVVATTPPPATPPIVLPSRPIAQVEQAVRQALPHLAKLLWPAGGLVNYTAGVIARAGLPSHVVTGQDSTGAPVLVHLARAVASTLVGLCATRSIGLQTFMERAHYAPGSLASELPAPGMLGVDDGRRGNPFAHK